tara:strand:- start:318 stop:491 length:174 start_codon:yes stop_codon:yes gene_type:complete
MLLPFSAVAVIAIMSVKPSALQIGDILQLNPNSLNIIFPALKKTALTPPRCHYAMPG